mgnify:CR=1 FL=1
MFRCSTSALRITREHPSSQYVDVHGIREHEMETVTVPTHHSGWVFPSGRGGVACLGTNRIRYSSIEHSSGDLSYPTFISADERATG